MTDEWKEKIGIIKKKIKKVLVRTVFVALGVL